MRNLLESVWKNQQEVLVEHASDLTMPVGTRPWTYTYPLTSLIDCVVCSGRFCFWHTHELGGELSRNTEPQSDLQGELNYRDFYSLQI